MVNPVLLATIEDNFDAMVRRSQEILMTKLGERAEDVDPQLALQCAALGAKATGRGGFGAKAAVNVNVNRGPDWLEQSAARLRALNNQGVTDVQVREVQSPAG